MATQQAGLVDTLNRMNWTWGKGDIVAVGDGDVTRRMTSGTDTRRYTLLDGGRKVRFLGRTRVIRTRPSPTANRTQSGSRSISPD